MEKYYEAENIRKKTR